MFSRRPTRSSRLGSTAVIIAGPILRPQHLFRSSFLPQSAKNPEPVVEIGKIRQAHLTEIFPDRILTGFNVTDADRPAPERIRLRSTVDKEYLCEDSTAQNFELDRLLWTWCLSKSRIEP
jgi:hypothetical protein